MSFKSLQTIRSRIRFPFGSPNLQQRVVIGFGLISAISIGIGWVDYRAIAELVEARKWERHTHQVLETLTAVFSGIQDVETGQRGYMLYGQETFLEPYYIGLKTTPQDIRTLRRLTHDNLIQQQRITMLESLAAKKIAIAKMRVEARRSSGLEASKQVGQFGSGNKTMQNIRWLIQVMEDTETQLLRQRSQRVKVRTQEAFTLSLAGLGLNLAILLGLYYLINREMTQRQRSELHLRVQHTIAQVLADSTTIDEAVSAILPAICEGLTWSWGEFWNLPQINIGAIESLPPNSVLQCDKIWHQPCLEVLAFESLTWESTFAPEVGLPGRVWASGEPIWLADVVQDPSFLRAAVAAQAGLHGAVAFPIQINSQVLGVLIFFSRQVRQPDPALLQIFAAIGSQVGQFIERKRTEAESLESEQRFRKLSEATFEGVAISEQGRVSDTNKSFVELFGYELAEVVGMSPINFVVPECHELVRQKVISGDEKVYETTCLKKDGTTFPAEIRGRMMPFHGRMVRVTAIRDITERKRYEEQLRVYAANLERANRELKQFNYIAAHDLKTPLRTITTRMGILPKQLKPLSVETQHQISRISLAAQQMDRLLNDLITYSQIGSRAKPPVPTDSNAILRQALEGLQNQIQQSGAVIEVEPDLPTLLADPNQLVLVFQNLISNSIKFCHLTPQINISTTCVQDECIFCVADNGIGIPARHEQQIFEPFKRLHSQEAYMGSGIGLAIAKRIIDQHGARIWVESEATKGSKFFFTLRRANNAGKSNRTTDRNSASRGQPG